MLVRFTICLSFMVASVSAHAAEIRWNGFASTGFERSSNDDHVYDGVDKDGSFTNPTILGLNLSTSISDQVSFAAQLVTQADKNFAIQADWITGSFRLIPNLTLRVGKVKYPIWMTSAYIDVKKTYPWVTPPREVYGLNPFKAFMGASLDYSYFFGDLEGQVELYGGRIDETLGEGTQSETAVLVEDMVGVAATFTYDFVAFKMGYSTGRTTIGQGEGPTAINLAEESRTNFTSFGFTVDWNNLLVMSEYVITDSLKTDKEKDIEKAARTQANQAAAGAQQAATAAQAGAITPADAQAIADTALAAEGLARIREADFFKNQAFYITLGYKVDQVTPLITYANGDAKTDKPLFAEDQSSMTYGLAWDVNPQTALKFEYTQVKVGDDSWGRFEKGGSPIADAPSNLDGTNVMRTSIDYIF